MSDIQFDIYESPDIGGKKKEIPSEKHQQTEHPFERPDARGIALCLREPFGLVGSRRPADRILQGPAQHHRNTDAASVRHAPFHRPHTS